VVGTRHDLSGEPVSGCGAPQGHTYLKEFRIDPFPVFVYQAEGMEIEKRVFMPHGVEHGSGGV